MEQKSPTFKMQEKDKAKDDNSGNSKLSIVSKLFKKDKSNDSSTKDNEETKGSKSAKNNDKTKGAENKEEKDKKGVKVKLQKDSKVEVEDELNGAEKEVDVENEEKKEAEGKESILKGVDDFSRQLIEVMSPVILDLDNRIMGVKHSQVQLQSLINQLIEELSTYSSMAHPPKLQSDIDKLVNSRRRLAAINNTLTTVQDRLDHILAYGQNSNEN